MSSSRKNPPRQMSPFVAELVGKLPPPAAPIPTPAQILTGAYVSDNIPQEILDALPPEDVSLVQAAQSRGHRLVRVYWVTGQCALLLCPVGSDMPEPQMVLQAYERIEAQRFKDARPAGGRHD